VFQKKQIDELGLFWYKLTTPLADFLLNMDIRNVAIMARAWRDYGRASTVKLKWKYAM